MPRVSEPRRTPPTALAGERGRFRLAPLGVVAGLLVLPAVATYRGLGPDVTPWVLVWAAVASMLTFVAYAVDKRRAKVGGWREPEKALHLGALLGGWPGAFLAQRWLRHKSAKISFRCIFWLIVGVYEFVALDSLLGWPIIRQAGEAVRLLWRG